MLRDRILLGAFICVIAPLMMVMEPLCPPEETPTPTGEATSFPSDTPSATAVSTSPLVLHGVLGVKGRKPTTFHLPEHSCSPSARNYRRPQP
jgi:hypothetical protein